MSVQLGFIKVRNGGGTVEVHLDSLQSNTYKRSNDYTSDFSPADADNGTWQLYGSQNGAPLLGFIKVRNGGGTVEVHLDSLQSNTYRRIADYTSDFSPADADNGTWQLYESEKGAPPLLVFIKVRNGGGTVEIHVDSLQGNTYKRIADYTSDFSPADADNGTWQLWGGGLIAPNLGFTRVRNGGSTVEVHLDSLHGISYQRDGDYTSDFSPADADNGTWQLLGPVLGFIKLRNGGGTVEVHLDEVELVSGSSGDYKRSGDYTSDFSPADANNGTWQLLSL